MSLMQVALICRFGSLKTALSLKAPKRKQSNPHHPDISEATAPHEYHITPARERDFHSLIVNAEYALHLLPRLTPYTYQPSSRCAPEQPSRPRPH